MNGYRHCAHDNCFAIIVGKPGDLCDDCLTQDEGHDAKSCDLCDYDEPLILSTTARGHRAQPVKFDFRCPLCRREFDDPKGCDHIGNRSVDA